MEDASLNKNTKFQDLDRLWNPADPASSEAALKSLLAEAQSSDGGERDPLIELYSLIARAESFQGKLGPARASLGKAQQLLEEQKDASKVSVRIRWLIEMGRLQILEKTPSQARALFSEAWNLAGQSGEDYFAVEIAQLMAKTEPPKAQQGWIVRAIEIAESSPLPKTKRWLGTLYSGLAWKLYDLKQYEKALELFQKSLGHLKTNGTAKEAFVAQWSIGKVLRTLGKTEEALAIQKALLAELGIGGARDGRLYEELAECLHTLKREAEAQPFYELAYQELSKDEWVTDNRPVELKRLKDLGKVK